MGEREAEPLAPHETIHIAGQPVRVGDQVRQRCSWCGFVLVDHDLACVAVPISQLPPEGEESPFGPVPMWGTGELVAHDGAAWWVVTHEDGAVLPPGSCALLPHDLTGS